MGRLAIYSSGGGGFGFEERVARKIVFGTLSLLADNEQTKVVCERSFCSGKIIMPKNLSSIFSFPREPIDRDDDTLRPCTRTKGDKRTDGGGGGGKDEVCGVVVPLPRGPYATS